MNNRYHVPAIDRAFRIIECLAGSDGPERLSDLSADLKIPKTTALMILITLENLGYVLKTEDGKYQLSTKLLELGSKGLSLKELAQSHLERLAEDVKLTVHLSALQDDENVIISKVNGPGFIQFSTFEGKRQAFHATSSGKAILAYLSSEKLGALFPDKQFQSFTSNTINNIATLNKELITVREQGYAIEDQEEEMGVRCVGAPIFNASGSIVGAVSVTGIISELPTDSIHSIAMKVKKTGDFIASKLGYSQKLKE
ncbi:helix-turn-helix domain-containing protein [Paenibacillus sp. LMG 31456]|uniref:Helix-turn-helix domain-containing protein n=1 Tax=Paenibacillus foliorum TaxID=2654974 RepID=A0A972H0Z5_9BACL|nr:IclR family transcriptional regulator [Paenibacillus foliorum]NOU97833.1 helix-turn-helix domain-containing protein [Paenibacillus foliorum]